MRVFIITEGGVNIGIGHITRCISLYQAFEEKGIISEFAVNGDETVEDLLKDKRYRILNWLKERERVFSMIENADIVIVDSYLAEHEFYKKVSETVSVSVSIDDTARIDYPKGIVINGSIYAEELNYTKRNNVTYLLSTRYLPIRKEFWDMPEKEIKENIESVIITFGGDDSRNMTVKVLKLLVDNYPELTKNVIIGKGFQNTNVLEKLKDNNTKLIYYPNAEGMKNIMLESDIAISAGGQTLYELARVGVPTIAVAVADNQMNNIIGWEKAGFIKYAGWWEDEKVQSNILMAIGLLKDAGLREKMTKIGRELIDGFGAERIARYCIEKLFTDRLILRKAEARDIYNTYELSNEQETRKSSFNEKKIELEEHKKWFLNKLNEKESIFLIAESDNEFLGQVRFDINGKEAGISISVNKKYRGLGIGKTIIQKAIDILRSERQDILYVKSYIKEKNTLSIRLFEKTDFQFIREAVVKGQDAFEYQYQLGKKV